MLDEKENLNKSPWTIRAEIGLKTWYRTNSHIFINARCARWAGRAGKFCWKPPRHNYASDPTRHNKCVKTVMTHVAWRDLWAEPMRRRKQDVCALLTIYFGRKMLKVVDHRCWRST